jgi:hypothetical protein
MKERARPPLPIMESRATYLDFSTRLRGGGAHGAWEGLLYRKMSSAHCLRPRRCKKERKGMLYYVVLCYGAPYTARQ